MRETIFGLAREEHRRRNPNGREKEKGKREKRNVEVEMG